MPKDFGIDICGRTHKPLTINDKHKISVLSGVDLIM